MAKLLSFIIEPFIVSIIVIISIEIHGIDGIKFDDCSGALVQTVLIDSCENNRSDNICRINRTFVDDNTPLILPYHVDFVANQVANQIQLRILMKTNNFGKANTWDNYDDTDYEELARFDDLCATMRDVCPTRFNVLHHFYYGIRIDNLPLMQNRNNQEIILKNVFTNRYGDVLACFKYSLMIIDESRPMPMAKTIQN